MIDKKLFTDSNDNPLTQSLFLELGYNVQYAIYTLKEQDYEYKGKLYPSLKRLYLEEEDPTEYMFSQKYLLNYPHWKRICANKQIRVYIDEWREELELRLRAQAVKSLIDMTANGNFQAAKFLADRGWDKNKVGRPSKEELEKRVAIGERVSEDFQADIARLEDYRR